MSDKRVNVLVYSGNGATVESVRHCLWSLRRLLGPNYAVIPISGEAVLREPWPASCALFVMPGGADLGYCRTLNGEGNRRISQYVNKGGAYLGLCAGGYYGCQRCEFEEGKQAMEVVGDRELAFYPGICRGLAFPGFVYHSEVGTRAAELKVNRAALPTSEGLVPEVFRSYYNGGGVFVDADKLKHRGVEVLASYTETLSVDSGEGAAAVVYRKIGEGSVILTGPHPEFAAVNLDKGADIMDYAKTVEVLAADDKQRVDFMKACLTKLGLHVNPENEAVPSLSRIHLSATPSSDISELVSDWTDILSSENGQDYIRAEQDTFQVEKQSTWSLANVAKALPEVVQSAMNATPGLVTSGDEKTEAESKTEEVAEKDSGIVDYDKIIKRIVTHETSLPESKETPYFNHHAFFANLQHYNSVIRTHEPTFGRVLMYGEVVTSTNSLLEKNPKLLSALPIGTTLTATTQLAGRGRGSNIWVSPPGSLMFSTVLRHPLSLSATAPVVFIQYLVALAIVQGIQTYDRGYDKLPVKLKWPNDIYALLPSLSTPNAPSPTTASSSRPATDYVKIGGILINSSYSGGDYTLVCGVGLNVSNAAPTTSLNALCAAARLPAMTPEKLLAAILSRFEALHRRFASPANTAAFAPFLDDYYRAWLHQGQLVTLETEGGMRARIKGISPDWGLLVAEELGWEDRPTGKVVQLQSDSNSFDFFKGLVRRKA
ncbi:hypothetical protein MBLNU459_g7569t1 [Dothideomycetes sp. NU459]